MLFRRNKPPEPPKQERPQPAPKPNFLHNLSQQKTWEGSFEPYRAPLGVVPADKRKAYDSAINTTAASVMPFVMGHAGVLQSWIADGLGFLGYPYLAEMAQRAEFRKPCDVIAREATREWIKLRYDTDDESDDARIAAEIEGTNLSQQKVDTIEDELKRLNIRKIIHTQVMHGLLYGIGHVVIDVAAQHGETDTALPLPITPQCIKQGSLRGFKNLEPIWATPTVYNTFEPFREDFYKPQAWYVMGREVHVDRLIDMIPYEVSDLLKPAFNFGGLSLTQQLRPYVHNFLRTRNSVSDITANFSKLVLLTDMTGNMAGAMPSGQEAPGMRFGDIEDKNMIARASWMQRVSEAQSTIVADKNAEDVKVVATPLGGLNDLQASAMEAMASIPGIPLVKLFGIQPTGFNASSEGEIRVFYDEIASLQEAHVRPALEKMINIIQLNLWGEIDPRLSFEFAPLWQLDEERSAAVEKLRADIDLVNIQAGKISPDEARMREQHSDTSIYAKVDLSGEAPAQSYTDQSANAFQPGDFIGGTIRNGDTLSK